jgi:hypothetical protein
VGRLVLQSYILMDFWYREIEDMVLLALKRPEVYDNIARGTRRKFESNRPRAILFEGPPVICLYCTGPVIVFVVIH